MYKSRHLSNVSFAGVNKKITRQLLFYCLKIRAGWRYDEKKPREAKLAGKSIVFTLEVAAANFQT